MSESVDVEVTFLGETEGAVLVNDGDAEVWIPKSQIEDVFEYDTHKKGDELTITIPEWLAIDKEFI